MVAGGRAHPVHQDTKCIEADARGKCEAEHASLTEFATPSWPLNLRMIRPVATSHEKTERSPPHDANLPCSQKDLS